LEENLFKDWMKSYNKNYHDLEYAHRLENYKKSVKIVQRLKTEYPEVKWKLNKFSDLSTEEFREKYLKNLVVGSVEPELNVEAEFVERVESKLIRGVSQDPPATYDWRQKELIFPDEETSSCGSTTVEAAIETVQYEWMVVNGKTVANTKPAGPDQIFKCSTLGCEVSPNSVFSYIKVFGLTTNFSTCPIKPDICISDFTAFTLPEADLRGTLTNTGPFTVAVDTSTWQFYQGGILTGATCGNNIDTVVVAIGYDTTVSSPFWILRNYWGTDWGEGGYIRIEYGKNACGITNSPFMTVPKPC